jgi:hypothetical protein
MIRALLTDEKEMLNSGTVTLESIAHGRIFLVIQSING